MHNLPSLEPRHQTRKLIRRSLRYSKTMTDLGVDKLFLAFLAAELFCLARGEGHIFSCSFFGRIHLKMYAHPFVPLGTALNSSSRLSMVGLFIESVELGL